MTCKYGGCSSLISINIPDKIANFGKHVFSYCHHLVSITVSSRNTKYDSRNNCNAIIETATSTLIAGCQSTVIPDSVTTIKEGAFSHISAPTPIFIPGSVKKIESEAFVDCSPISVSLDNPVYDSRNDCNAIIKTASNELIAGCHDTIIPDSVVRIGWYAFRNCHALTSINIPENVKEIGWYAFSDCNGLTSINIPDSVTSTGYAAFLGCYNLKFITLGKRITKIDGHSFKNCINLESISIPTNVTYIGECAFLYCSRLKSIHFLSPNPCRIKIDNSALADILDKCTLFIPKGTKQDYLSHPVLGKFQNIMEENVNIFDGFRDRT